MTLAALGEDLTQLALQGTYEPPLGTLGAALDRMLLHRIAEASVKRFVERLARIVEDEAAPEPRPARLGRLLRRPFARRA